LYPLKKLELLSPSALLLLPTVLWLGVFLLIPLAILAVCSFGSRDEVGRLVLACTLSNYERFFAGPYLLSLWRSVTLASLTTLCCLVIGLSFSLWLAFNVPKGRRNLYLTLFTAPLWTSFLLRIYAWMIILRPTGLLASACESLNLPAPHLMYNYGAILLGMIYNYLPYMVLPLYAAVEKLDTAYLEAAADLGATPLQSFFKVTVPLTSRGIVAGCIMVFIPALGDYVTPDLLGGAKTMFIGNLIQNQFLTIRDWAFGSAVSTILIVIVGVAVWIYLKYGETSYARPSTN
jgi:spermidine/putrescine transport system permease protein